MIASTEYVNLRHKVLPLTLFSVFLKMFSEQALLFSESARRLAMVELNYEASDTLKILQEIKSSRTSIFCKNDFL